NRALRHDQVQRHRTRTGHRQENRGGTQRHYRHPQSDNVRSQRDNNLADCASRDGRVTIQQAGRKMSQILVVDDEVGIRELLSEILRDEGHQVRLAQNADEARQIRGRVRPDLVLLDIWMPDTDGITLLKEWASTGLLTMPVVMMSGHGTIDTAVEATRIGAYAFLEKPIALQKLLSTVGTALKQGASRVSAPAVLITVGKTHAADQLRAQLDRLRALKTPALFVGEPGTGMEQCARLLHQPNTAWVAPEDLAAFDQAENNLV